MVIIYESIKLFRKSLLLFCIFFNLIFIFPKQILSHETYGDAMRWYNDFRPSVDPKQNFLIGLKFENGGNSQKALFFFK